MKKIFILIIINVFVYSSYSEIPDIKKLWKKHDVIKTENIETKSEFQIASDYVKAGEYNKALQIYEKMLNKNTSSSHLHTAIGFCFEKMGETEKAVMLYQKAISLTPVDPVAFNNLAYIIAQKAVSPEDVLPALKLSERALKYKKDNISFIKTRLFVLKRSGLIEKWEKETVDFLERYPNVWELSLDIGKYYLNNKNITLAKKYLNAALPSEEALELLGKIPDSKPVIFDSNDNVLYEKEEKKEISNNLEKFKEFQKDFGINFNSNNNVEYKEEKTIKSTSTESIKKEENTQPNIVVEDNSELSLNPILDLRIAYDDDFEKGLKNYREGYFENALNYFDSYIKKCEQNKDFNEKLARAYKYKGLINTRNGDVDNRLWDKIAFIDKAVLVEKMISYNRLNSKEMLRDTFKKFSKLSNVDDYHPFITLNLSELKGLGIKKKSFIEYFSPDFELPSLNSIRVSLKGREFFSEGYKSILENKILESEKFFNLALNQDKDNFGAYYNISVINLRKENYDKALDNIKLAHKYCPYNDPFFKIIRELYNKIVMYYFI